MIAVAEIPRPAPEPLNGAQQANLAVAVALVAAAVWIAIMGGLE